MKRLTDFLKSHRKILIISCLLVVLIGLAFLLYGSKNKLSAVSANDVIRSETEVKLMRILSEIEGVGKAEVMINEGKEGISGVVIVCEGAYNVIMSSLVLLLAVTAVLNVVLVNRRTTAQADAIQTANYFTSFRSERTSKRSEELLQIDSVIDKYEAGSEKYESAMDMKLKIVGIMENELVIETMIKSLGFSDAVVSIGMGSDNVNVFINTNELDESAALSIYDVLTNELGVAGTDIIIMPVYTQI